jgi:hypothetical protein
MHGQKLLRFVTLDFCQMRQRPRPITPAPELRMPNPPPQSRRYLSTKIITTLAIRSERHEHCLKQYGMGL